MGRKWRDSPCKSSGTFRRQFPRSSAWSQRKSSRASCEDAQVVCPSPPVPWCGTDLAIWRPRELALSPLRQMRTAFEDCWLKNSLNVWRGTANGHRALQARCAWQSLGKNTKKLAGHRETAKKKKRRCTVATARKKRHAQEFWNRPWSLFGRAWFMCCVVRSRRYLGEIFMVPSIGSAHHSSMHLRQLFAPSHPSTEVCAVFNSRRHQHAALPGFRKKTNAVAWAPATKVLTPDCDFIASVRVYFDTVCLDEKNSIEMGGHNETEREETDQVTGASSFTTNQPNEVSLARVAPSSSYGSLRPSPS